jgi:hypothetical protein
VLRPGCGRSHRISSNFTGTFPGYDAVWVDLVVADGSGKVIPLAGNDFLRIRFSQATAHDASGAGSVQSAPRHVGYKAINGGTSMWWPSTSRTGASAAIRSDRHAVTSQR